MDDQEVIEEKKGTLPIDRPQEYWREKHIVSVDPAPWYQLKDFNGTLIDMEVLGWKPRSFTYTATGLMLTFSGPAGAENPLYLRQLVVVYAVAYFEVEALVVVGTSRNAGETWGDSLCIHLDTLRSFYADPSIVTIPDWVRPANHPAR